MPVRPHRRVPNSQRVRMLMGKRDTLRTLSVMASLALTSTGAFAQDSPADWLERMANAVTSTSYQGTVIRQQRGKSEALKVVRSVVDGVVNERLASQEGDGLEIIRIGDEVHCILPDKKTVLVEGWNNQSTLFTSLPRSEVTSTPLYDLSVVRQGRIAGRDAVLLAVRPHDEYRYAHRIWLDETSGFPLQTELLGLDGEVIEEIKFAEFAVSNDIAPETLGPSNDLAGYTWYRQNERTAAIDAETDWVCDDLPAGFSAISTKTESIAGDAGPEDSTHIVYSDGVATVSVFISAGEAREQAGWAIVGTASSYTVQMDGFEVTAFGEVPGITVQRIASSMRRQ